MEQFGVWADSLFCSVEISDSCPVDEGNDTPESCEDDKFILLSQEGNAISEMPIRDLNDEINFLAQHLTLRTSTEVSASVESIPFDPEFFRSEQDCSRDSRPIRGPSV